MKLRLSTRRKLHQFNQGGSKKMFSKVVGKVVGMIIGVLIALLAVQAQAGVLFQDGLEGYVSNYQIPLDKSDLGLLSGQRFGECKAGGAESGTVKAVAAPVYAGGRALQITAGAGADCRITARVILQLGQGNYVFSLYARAGSSNGSSDVLLLAKDKDDGYVKVAETKVPLKTSYQLLQLPLSIGSSRAGHKIQFEIMNDQAGTTLFVDEIKISTTGGIVPPPTTSPDPTLVLAPTSGSVGTVVTVSGQNFPAGQNVQLEFDGQVLVNGLVTNSVSFTLNLIVPQAAIGSHTIMAKSGGKIKSALFIVTTPPAPVTPANTVKVTELLAAKKFQIEVSTEAGAEVTAYIGDQGAASLKEMPASSSGHYEGVFDEARQVEYTAKILVKVKKGNVSMEINGPTITVDTLVRVESLTISPEQSAYRSGTRITLSALAEAGLKVYLDAATLSLSKTFAEVGSGSYQAVFILPSVKDGSYELKVRFVKNVNIPSNSRLLSIVVDNTAPAITLQDYFVESAKLKIKVHSDDIGAVVKLKTGEIFTNYGQGNFIGALQLASGQTKVDTVVIAQDQAGNKSELSLNILITPTEGGTGQPGQSGDLTTQMVVLNKGINLFSLTVNIAITGTPYLSQLVDQIGASDVVMIIYFDNPTQKFKAYMLGYPDRAIQKGEGLIVVMQTARQVTLVGSPWEDLAGPDFVEWDYIKLVKDIEIQLGQSEVKELWLGLQKVGLIKPEKTALLQNFPNPFNPETWIPYQLAEKTEVVIKVFTSQGQLIRQIDIGQRDSGVYLDRAQAAHWDGKNNFGEKVSSGIYFYTLQAGKFIATRRMVIMK